MSGDNEVLAETILELQSRCEIVEEERDHLLDVIFELRVRERRMALAEQKLLEFDIEWDGEKYVFTPRQPGGRQKHD